MTSYRVQTKGAFYVIVQVTCIGTDAGQLRRTVSSGRRLGLIIEQRKRFPGLYGRHSGENGIAGLKPT
jgi:hypothetical protein